MGLIGALFGDVVRLPPITLVGRVPQEAPEAEWQGPLPGAGGPARPGPAELPPAPPAAPQPEAEWQGPLPGAGGPARGAATPAAAWIVVGLVLAAGVVVALVARRRKKGKALSTVV